MASKVRVSAARRRVRRRQQRDRQKITRALDVLNNTLTCIKCGAQEGVGNSHPLHNIEYIYKHDLMMTECWRCEFVWTRHPEDRKDATE